MNAKRKTTDWSQAQGTVLLPLFPLRLVLFPGQVLPLHIFEPRYRLMINQCIQESQPFGIVLMREDIADWREYQENVALPYSVGTTAHIRQVERLPDGRLNIITVGLHRFRVRSLRFDQPYLQGEVENYPLALKEDMVSMANVSAVRRLLRGYLEILAQFADAEVDLDEMPEDPKTLAYLVASVLQVPWDDKQALLDVAELPTLLDAERMLLGREKMILHYMQSTRASIEEQALGPTGYLLPN